MDRTRQATAGISMARITSQAVPFITTLTISIPMSRGPAPRQLPWVDWEEWDAVRRNLFSASGNDQAWAVGVVSLWRRRGRVPHAVESTAQLIEISIGDPSTTTVFSGGRSDNELRLSYALCVVRAVNGLVDPQQQSYFAGSVLALAAKIGIPGWIVELRHDATHSDLPSLSVLRHAAHTLLAWYEVNYWQYQAQFLRGLSLSVLENGPNTTPVSHDSNAADRKPLSLSSFSHIVIPQLVNDLCFFELEVPDEISAFDKFKTTRKTKSTPQNWESELIDFFERSRWRCNLDVILQQAPQWGADCLVGHALFKMILLHRQQDEGDGDDLVEWRVFMLCSLIAYVLHHFGGTYSFSCIIRDHNECTALADILFPIQAIIADMKGGDSISDESSIEGARKKCRYENSNSNYSSDADRVVVSRVNSEYNFRPVLWPIGSMPGSLDGNLFDIEVGDGNFDCQEDLPGNVVAEDQKLV